MATNKRFMPVPPEAVWDVLADPGSYGYWVVGSKVIRDAEPEWPANGSKFHHTIGAGPFTVSDHTEVVQADRPTYFQLRAKGRPAGTATVTMRMTPRPEAGGTLVQMTENPDGPFGALALNPLTHVFTIARNAESLMRLEELALLQNGEDA
jgi:carbon monoxide dehydrogenase subunit G